MPVEMTEDKVMERIMLLLRKAETTTPEEAEALTEQAERLMVRHAIDQAKLDAAKLTRGETVKVDPIRKRDRTFLGGYAVLEAQFLSLIVQAFGVRTVQYAGRSYRQLIMIGHESDLDRALTVADSLRTQATVAMAKWEKTDYEVARVRYVYGQGAAAKIRSLRRSYLLGFAAGASQRIRRNRSAAEQEVKGTGTDLVLADRRQAVQRFIDDEFGRLRSGRSSTSLNQHAAGAGRRDGNAASTGERRPRTPSALPH